jgi:hypothetical protein
VIFKEEPDYIDEDHYEWTRYNTTGSQVCLREEQEKKNVIGNMDDHIFRIVFPDCDLSEISQGRIDSSELFGRPLETEVSKTIEVELTAPFDDDGYLMNMGTDVDGWN